jgi:hypothetical protein
MKKCLLFIILTVFCFSCGFPSEQKVKDEFKSANPTFEPISAVVGEGHGDAAYYHIRYKKPSDDKTYEQVYLYLRQADGEIKLYSKEEETVAE